MKINFEFDEKLAKKIESITGESVKDINGKTDLDILESIIEDLINECDYWKEQYEDLQDNVKENYKFIGQYED